MVSWQLARAIAIREIAARQYVP